MTPPRKSFALLTLALVAGLPVAASSPRSEPIVARTPPSRLSEAQAHVAFALAPRGLGSDHSAVLLRAATDARGETTARFQQRYRGVPVSSAIWGPWPIGAGSPGRITGPRPKSSSKWHGTVARNGSQIPRPSPSGAYRPPWRSSSSMPGAAGSGRTRPGNPSLIG